MWLDILKDTGKDSIKLIPFLLLTYLLMEALEHRAGKKLKDKIQTASKSGPLWGGILGVIPQCGFSAAASSLYAGKVITAGTLLAVYLSTSDEMLPVMISEAIAPGTVCRILAMKAAIGIISGFAVNGLIQLLFHPEKEEMNIHVICEEEHCRCENGIFRSALMHTLKIFLYIFLISLVLNVVLGLMGEEALKEFLSSFPLISHITCALIGLIPNCASSVVITKLYTSGVISTGVMMSGLLVNAGVGLLVLFRLNRKRKENMFLVTGLFLLGILWGVLIDLSGVMI